MKGLNRVNLISHPPVVFISYARADSIGDSSGKSYLDRVLMALKPLSAQGLLRTYCDQDLHAGETWSDSLSDVLLTCKAAVILVGPAFLASDFIRSTELPIVLERE